MSSLNLFSDHPLIDALGWTLIHSLWQIALWAIIAVTSLVALHRTKAKVRYFILAVILLCICLTSSLTFFTNYKSANSNNKQTAFFSIEEEAVDNSNKIRKESISIVEDQIVRTKKQVTITWLYSYFERHLPAIVALWFLGFIFLFLKYVGGMAWMLRLKSTSKPLNESFQGMIFNYSVKLRLSRIVYIATSVKINTPVVIGYFKPVILFPVSLITGLSDQEIESILLHELAHIKRNDYLVNLMQSFLEVVFFYHPALWWLSNALRTEREYASDDLAVKQGANVNSMARSITEVASLSIDPPNYSVAFSGKQHKLKTRINRLIQKETMKTNMKPKLVVAVIVLIAAVTMSFSVRNELLKQSDLNSSDNFTEMPVDDQKSDMPEIREESKEPKELIVTKEKKELPKKDIFIEKIENQDDSPNNGKSASDNDDDDDDGKGLALIALMKQGVKDWNVYRENHAGDNFDDALKESDLAGLDLSNFNLAYLNLKEANLKGVDFSNANMEGVNIKEANVENAIFRAANLANANMKELELRGCELQKANLSGANLKEITAIDSDFSGVNLSGAILHEATFKNCKFKGAYADHTTTFPPGFDVNSAGIVIK